MPQNYATYLTQVGKDALATAGITGSTLGLTYFAIGDANGADYNADPSNVQLVHEVYRSQINDLYVDPTNPDWIVAEFIVPANIGGWTVREIALIDNANKTIVLGTTPTLVKPLLASGAGLDLHMKVVIDVGNTALVTLVIEPTSVLATRAYVDAAVQGNTAGTPIYATFTGDGTSTNFAVTNLQSDSPPSLLVTVDGVEQRWSRDYTLLLSTYTTVLFTTPPPDQSDINIRTFVAITQQGLWSPTPDSIMKRDGSGRSQVVDGVAAQDIATYGQISALATQVVQDVQAQAISAFTTAGTSPAYTLTTTPAYGALNAGQRFRVKFHASITSGTPTLNRDGLGAKNLVQYNNTGTKIAAVIVANILADVEYDGADFVVMDALPPAAFSLNRTVQTNLASTAAATDTGASITPGVTGTLPVTSGGTGFTAQPSLLTNLGSLSAASIFTASPRPGVTGILSIINGGTGASDANGALTNLGAITAPTVQNMINTTGLIFNGGVVEFNVNYTLQAGNIGCFGMFTARCTISFPAPTAFTTGSTFTILGGSCGGTIVVNGANILISPGEMLTIASGAAAGWYCVAAGSKSLASSFTTDVLVYAGKGSSQTVPANTVTTIPFTQKYLDAFSLYNTGNGIFTANATGLYLVQVMFNVKAPNFNVNHKIGVTTPLLGSVTIYNYQDHVDVDTRIIVAGSYLAFLSTGDQMYVTLFSSDPTDLPGDNSSLLTILKVA